MTDCNNSCETCNCITEDKKYFAFVSLPGGRQLLCKIIQSDYEDWINNKKKLKVLDSRELVARSNQSGQVSIGISPIHFLETLQEEIYLDFVSFVEIFGEIDHNDYCKCKVSDVYNSYLEALNAWSASVSGGIVAPTANDIANLKNVTPIRKN